MQYVPMFHCLLLKTDTNILIKEAYFKRLIVIFFLIRRKGRGVQLVLVVFFFKLRRAKIVNIHLFLIL